MTTPRERYDQLIGRITAWAIEETCGKNKTPKTQEQFKEIQTRLSTTIQNAQIFHLNTDLHEHQGWFLRLHPKKLIACTGNKWGKTFAMLVKAVVATLGCAPWDPDNSDEFLPIKHEPPIDVTVCGPDYASWIPLNLIPRLRRLIPFDALVPSVSRVQGQVIDGMKWWNGSTWKILSYVQDTVRYEGWSTHLCCWDEPMPQDKYVAAARGCIEFEAPHIMAYTPLSNPWVYDEFYDRGFKISTKAQYEMARYGKNAKLFDQKTGMELPLVVTGSIRDNPHLSKDAKHEFEYEVLRRKPWEKEARIFGKHQSLMGLVFPGWLEEKHVRPLETVLGS